MYDTSHIDDSNASSATAIVCEQAQLYGATPGPDEPDNRDLWDKDDAIQAVDDVFNSLSNVVAPDGTQLADERESMLWGFVNLFHAQVTRLDRAVDALRPKLRELEQAQDGTEINALELEQTVDRARNLGDRRDAFEMMRDHAASAYTSVTGSTWRPRRGSHTSQTAKLTSAAIDARDFLRAREHRANQAHLPDGTLVAVAGGKEAGNVDAICTALDRVKVRYPDMVLVHGGGPGAETIAARWAEANAVHQVVCKPDWNAHGRAAPFPAQRPASQSPAQGNRRVPRRRHHREPRRQGPSARHPRPPGRRVSLTASTGRVAAPRRDPSLRAVTERSPPPHAPLSSRTPRRLRRSFPAPPLDATASATAERCSSRTETPFRHRCTRS